MFTPKTFNIPELKGISAKNIEEHTKLYEGYVKNANLIQNEVARNQSTGAEAVYIISELQRRFAFEYNGMRNHEVYFSSLEGGHTAFNPESELGKRLVELFGSYENFVKEFSALALTRGIGWAVLWYDRKENKFLASWVDEQHLGQLNGCEMILALDMWEHSYVADYQPSGKKQYVADFFENLNWSVVEKNFA